MTFIKGKELLETEDFIDDLVSGLSKSEYQDHDGRIHASTTGYCPRRGALEANYQGNRSYGASSTLYMGIGSSIEDMILDSLDRNKKLLFRQYQLPEIGINLGGRVDGIILHNGKLHVLEIKSCGKLPSKANLEHQNQLMIYSAVTGLPALLLYVSRNVADFNGNIQMKLYEYGFDVTYTQDCLANAALAYFASKNKLLPEIPRYIRDKSDCGFCPFTNICWDYEPQTFLEPMSDSENAMIENAVETFITGVMSVSEITKRRNGVLKYLSLHGNKTAKFYLENEDWDTLLLEY